MIRINSFANRKCFVCKVLLKIKFTFKTKEKEVSLTFKGIIFTFNVKKEKKMYFKLTLN